MLLMLAVAQFNVVQEKVDAISDDDGIPFYRILQTGAPTIIENATNSPTISLAAPTSHPSATPITVSMQPWMRPSVSPGPTQSMAPSSSPSWLPLAAHSASPTTFAPTASPTRMPTLSTELIVQPKIRMVIEGMPDELGEQLQYEWEQLTSDHVFDYFKDLYEVAPDLAPVNLTKVITIFKAQSIATQSKSGDGVVLMIEYSQNVTFGIWDLDFDKDLNEFLFVAPFFEYDREEYLITLDFAWDLLYWLGLGDVVVGEAYAPTMAPRSPPVDPKGPTSQTGKRAISACMVLFAYLTVGACLWDNHLKKKAFYQESQVQQWQSESDGTVEFTSLSPSPTRPKDCQWWWGWSKTLPSTCRILMFN
jgi:hypothetical protein